MYPYWTDFKLGWPAQGHNTVCPNSFNVGLLLDNSRGLQFFLVFRFVCFGHSGALGVPPRHPTVFTLKGTNQFVPLNVQKIIVAACCCFKDDSRQHHLFLVLVDKPTASKTIMLQLEC